MLQWEHDVAQGQVLTVQRPPSGYEALVFNYGDSYCLMYQKAKWQELAYEAGYYDHSHFIKDFQFFNRDSPTAYLQQHKELIHYLEKES